MANKYAVGPGTSLGYPFVFLNFRLVPIRFYTLAP